MPNEDKEVIFTGTLTTPSKHEKEQLQKASNELLLNRLAEMFSYHPPQTEWRKEAHNAVNDAAFRFVKEFAVLCPNLTEAELMQVVTAIQNARMLANQIITYKEVFEGHRDVNS